MVLYLIYHNNDFFYHKSSQEWPEGCYDCGFEGKICCNFGNGIGYCTSMEDCPSFRQSTEVTSKLG